MAIVLDGTAGITTPDITSDGGLTADGVSFASGAPANTLVTTSSGNVGIGTSSPGYKLDVKGAIGFGSTTIGEIGGSGGNPYIGSVGALPFNIFTNGSERMRIDSSGNVGIGTNAISSIGAGYTTVAISNSTGGGISYQIGSTLGGQVYVNAGGMTYTAEGATYHRWYTNGSERARIDSSGNLLVGKTSSSDSTTGVRIGSNGLMVPARAGGESIAAVRLDSDGSVQTFFRGTTGGSVTQVGRIDVTTTATSYVTSSDYRLKENIAPMTGALAKVTALKPVTYSWKLNGETTQGFIAHELQAIVPECVVGEKDAVDADGNPVYQGIDTSFLVATLTAAIQEQQAIIAQLRADVAALKAKA